MQYGIRISTVALVLVIPCAIHCLAAEPATRARAHASQEGRERLQIAASSGFDLTATQAGELEERTKKNPDDAESHAKLLGYLLAQRHDSAEARESFREHALWMIRNRPADDFAGTPFCKIDPVLDPDGYGKARDLWMQQVDAAPQSAPVLANAAQFFLLRDRKRAEDLLQRAGAADPTNPKWPEQLAHMHDLVQISDRPPIPADAARQALAEYEQALSLTTNPSERFYRLTALPQAAFGSADNERAKKYAEQLLAQAEQFRNDWNYGNAIYKGNMVLGQVALAAGDVNGAKVRLLAAAKTPGSPQLSSFGPNMSLARGLLEKGERQVVLQFFELCGNFWKMGAEKLKAWAEVVRGGGTPDFGASLAY